MKLLIASFALLMTTASAQFTHDGWFGGKTEDEEAAIRALVRRIAPTVEPSLRNSDQLEFFLNSSVPGMASSIRIHSLLSLMILADKLETKIGGGFEAKHQAVKDFKDFIIRSKKKGYAGIESVLSSMSGGRSLQVGTHHVMIGDPVGNVADVVANISAVEDASRSLKVAEFAFSFLRHTVTLEQTYAAVPFAVYSPTDLVFNTIEQGAKLVEDYNAQAVGKQIDQFIGRWPDGIEFDGDTVVIKDFPQFNSDGWFEALTPYPLGTVDNTFWRVVELMLRVKSIYGDEDYQKQFGEFITALGASGVVQPSFNNSELYSHNNDWWSVARAATHEVLLDLGEGGNTQCKEVKVLLIPQIKTEGTQTLYHNAAIPTPNREISIQATAIGAAQTSKEYTLQATLIYDKIDGDGDPFGKFSVTLEQSIVIQNTTPPVTKANLPPIARPVTVEVDSSGTVNIPLDVFDPDGSISSISVVNRPLHSVKRIPGSPDWQDDFKGVFSEAIKLRYKHDGSAATTDTFTYTVTDDKGATSSPATVTINILASPTAPAIVTYPQTKQVEVGRSVAIRLSGSSSTDAPLTYTITAPPSAGQLTQPAPSSPKLRIYKAPISPGVQTLGYRVQDTLGNIKNEIVTINVVAASEQAPLATNVPVSVRAGGTVAFKLLASDADGGALTYQITSNPSRGAITGTPPNLTYAHNPASGMGSDSLTWQVTDLTGRTASAHAVFTVTNSEPVIAPLSNRTAVIGQPVIVGLRATDADGHPIELALASGSPGNIDGSNQWSHTFNTPGAYTVTVLASDRAAVGGAILSTVRNSFTVVVGGYTEFIDVPPSHPHFVTITDAARTRGFVGYPSGSDREFRPDQAITRGEFMTLVMRFTGTPVDTSGTLFPDVPSTHTHFAAIQTYKNQAFVVGYTDGTFRPDAALARQEMAIIFSNLAGWDDDEPVTSLPFADMPAAPPNGLTNSQWTAIYQSVGQLVRHSLASTANTNFRPFDNATRLEAVLMLSRFSNFDSQISIPNDGAYGNVNVTSDWSIRTFSILNEGTTAIQLTGTPAVSITGSAAADYTVVAQPSINIAAGAVISFKVRFDPSTTGSRPASLIIPTNSSILGSITIPLSGTGVSYAETLLNTTSQTFDYSGTHSGSITLQNGTLRLVGDLTINGTLKLKGGTLNLNGFNFTVGQDMEIGRNVILPANKTLQVSGDVIHSAGTVDLNGGRLEIGGSYYLQRDADANGTLETYSSGNLMMNDAADYMLVGGDVVIDNSESSSSNYFGAGTLEIRGAFTQKSTYSSGNAPGNFGATGTHRVLLSGTGVQTVSFENPGYSATGYSSFSILEVANMGAVDLRSVVNCSKLRGVFHQVGPTTVGAFEVSALDADLHIKGNVRFVGFNLNGHLLTVSGDVIHSAGTVDLNGGRLEIGGSYYLQRDADANGTLETYSSGALVMNDAADYMLVGGDVVIDNSESSNSNYFGAGTLEIRGAFTQKSTYSSGNAPGNFGATGTHRVLLSGTGVQTVSFENPGYSATGYSSFSILEMAAASSSSVVCLSRIYVTALLRHNQRTFTLAASAVATDFRDFDLDGMRDHQDPWPEDATNPGGFVTLSPETISKSDSAQSYSVDVSSNILWTRGGTLPAWMTVTPSSGLGNGTLTVTLQANAGAVERSGSFTVNGQTHTVTQDLNAAVAAVPGALDLPGAQLTMGGNAVWFSDASASPVTGSSAGASGLITHGQQTWMEMTVTGPVVLGFWWKVSSEATHDRLELAVDGTTLSSISGTVAWTKKEQTIAAGSHIVRWTYRKDGSVSTGSDRGWVDGVTLTPIAPEIVVEQPAGTDLISGTSSIGYGTVAIGSTVDRVFTIKNTGNTDLTLSSTPKVAVSGPDAALFTVITQPTSPVVMTGSTSFTVRFTPTSIGARMAAISITNNDADEGTFNLILTGTGTSTDATLTNLVLSSGTLTPAFASGIFSYTATAPNSTTTITLTPTVAESNAVVAVNGMSVASGNASDAIALSVGLNTFSIVVTAQDGITTKTYTIHVTRSALLPTVSSPTFTGVTASSALLGGNVISDGGGAITARGVVLAASSVNSNPLIGGLGVMNVVGTGTTGVFTVAVSSLAPGTTYSFAAYATNSEGANYSNVGAFSTPSNNASLASLTLSAGTLAPAFASGTANYTLTVPNDTLSVTAVPTTAESHALVTINGTAVASGNVSDSITLGASTATITTLVTAQDGTTTTYTVTVVKPGSLALANTTFTVTSGTMATTADIVIHRTGGLGGTVGGLLSTSIGTAVSPAQFTTQANAPFSLANTQTVQHVLIPIAANATTTTAKTFTVTISGASGGADLGTPISAMVIILPPSAGMDTTKPTVTITTPVNKASLNDNTPVIIAGIAKDNIAVSKVQVSLDNGANFNDAILTAPETASTNYSFAMTPITGLNSIQVRSIDFKGNISTVVTTSFTQLRTLAVAINGPANSGMMTAGFAPSSSRQVGKSYTITATPKTGYVFNGWAANDFTGTGVTAAAAELPALTVTFTEGLELTASFIANPFTPALIGSFNGIVLPDESTTPGVTNVGLLNITLTSKGSFTGSLKIDGASLSTPGFFDNAGVARFGKNRATSLLLARKNKPDLVIALQLDMTGISGRITGSITQNLLGLVQAVSAVTADRAHYSMASKVPSELAGTASKPYTLVIPAKVQTPAKALNTYPQGTGYATMTVKVAGTVSITGKLADNTALTASAPLSKLNQWPIFASLYSGKGCFAGLANLADADASMEDVTGTDFLWFRPAIAKVQWYPLGWPAGITVDLFGARYVVPPATPAASVFPGLLTPTSNATLSFSGGLGGTISQDTTISPTNTVTNIPAAASPTMTIAKATGLISGTFTHSDGTKPAYQGVILQKGSQVGGSGYFMSRATPVNGLGESGVVEVLAKPTE